MLLHLKKPEKESFIKNETISILKDILRTILLLIGATALGMCFSHLGFRESNIITVFILGVLIDAVWTQSHFCSFISSFCSVMLFNYFFTEPRLTFHAYEPEYYVTFVIMLMAALLTGTLAYNLKDSAKESAQAALIAQKEKLRADILRAISHDLRTPLTSISGNASNLLAHDKQLDEETRTQIFSDILDDSEWLINLVENLLSVTRIEDGGMNLNTSIELVDDVIDEAMKHIDRNKAEHKIIIKHSEDMLLAQMDGKLIVQVIINIVNNAIKYTQKGSEIVIESGTSADWVYVKISDNGPGMTAHVKEHAFDMFYTGQNKVADSKRSMGLGLALCKSVVDAHGGSIKIEDGVPSGCVITFYLKKGDVSLYE